tara:strand:+ start:160 stop:954 length:795 start_codon:yes stop_codon:yes gene_type:complete
MDLQDFLPDDLSRDLLSGSLRVAKDMENPVRMHLSAAGLRELFGHLLHTLAPDDEVRKCKWFEQAKDTPTVTRRQRATYATQGGFPDKFIASLGVDVEELHKEAIDAITELNKATHVRPQTLQQDPEAVDAFIAEAVGALEGLLISFSECRSSVQNALEKSVYESMMNALVTENFDTISSLSGRGYEVDLWIDDDDVEIVSISADNVLVRFSGIAPVTLHYGPKNDAAEISHDFPFWMVFEAKVETPTKLKLVDHFFDDSGWFE